MTKPKHTPGPLVSKLKESNNYPYGAYFIGPQFKPAGHIQPGGPGTVAIVPVLRNYRAETESNAHLIAAAPEMYDALERAYATLSDVAQSKERITIPSTLFRIMRDVMAKARGES